MPCLLRGVDRVHGQHSNMARGLLQNKMQACTKTGVCAQMMRANTIQRQHLVPG